MIISKHDIESMDRIARINLVNSVGGIKPANLIGTFDENGNSNLAIFNSAIHIGSNPALIGLVFRPTAEVRRHTYENIKQLGHYTINHVAADIIENSHHTSAKFPAGTSEFDACGLTEEYLEGFPAPFVGESSIKMGLKFVEEKEVEVNRTIVLIGSLELVSVPQSVFEDDMQIDLDRAESVGVGGLNTYFKLTKLRSLPYARPQDIATAGGTENEKV